MKDIVQNAKKLFPNRTIYRIWIDRPGCEGAGRHVAVVGEHSLTNQLLKLGDDLTFEQAHQVAAGTFARPKDIHEIRLPDGTYLLAEMVEIIPA